jgi:hypothetical protein
MPSPAAIPFILDAGTALLVTAILVCLIVALQLE